ncbi:hypothetical protein D3C87_1414560 [compost metagenome]
MQRSVTAASVVWPRASWKACRPSASPATVMAFGMSTACSARPSSTAGSRNRPNTGWISATRGSSSGQRSSTPSASAAASKPSPTSPASPNKSGRRQKLSARSLMTRRSLAGAGRASIHCACGVRAPWKICTWSASTPVTTWAPSPKWPGPKVSPACSTRRTAPKRGRSCACVRNTSSSLLPCRICCAAIATCTPRC